MCSYQLYIIVFLFSSWSISLRFVNIKIKRNDCRLLVNFGFFCILNYSVCECVFVRIRFFWFVFNFLGKSSIFICRIWNIAFFSKIEMRCICYMMYHPFSVACLNLWYNWLLRTSNAWLKPMNNTLFRIEDVYKLLRCVYILTLKTHRIENPNVKYLIAYQLIIC